MMSLPIERETDKTSCRPDKKPGITTTKSLLVALSFNEPPKQHEKPNREHSNVINHENRLQKIPGASRMVAFRELVRVRSILT